MMQKMIVLILAIAVFGLSGCAGSGGMIPLSDESITTVANDTTKAVGYITDASVMKEMAVHKTLQNRDKMIKEAQSNAGMKMKWVTVREEIQLPGQQPIILTRSMPEVSYTPAAEFKQPLPTAPNEHPGWRTAERIGVAAVNGTVIGLGITEGAGVLKSAIGAAGSKTTVQAEDINLENSLNKTDATNAGGGDMTVTGTAPPPETVVVKPEVVQLPAPQVVTVPAAQ